MTLTAQRCFEAFAPRVYRWALALCGRDADAQDITQEVFLRMTRRPPELPDESAAVAWLRRATSSVVIDRWRRRDESTGATLNSDVGAARSISVVESSERAERVREALSMLSEQQRIVLICKMYDEMTFQQIADELGIATPTVKTHYLRGLEALSRVLGRGAVLGG